MWAMPGDTSDRRLGAAVKELRLYHGLSIDAAAARGGMSATTWKKVEDGLHVEELTYRKLDRAFRLRRGLIYDVMTGAADWGELKPGTGAPADPPTDPQLRRLWDAAVAYRGRAYADALIGLEQVNREDPAS